MPGLWRTLLLYSVLSVAACQTGKPDEPQEVVHDFKGWYAGSVEEALGQARRTGTVVFVYWGAVWCPPCNQLNSEVFSQPGFAELMKRVVPVHLDGDHQDAQLWGERLQVSAYPTMLLLDSEANELARMSETATLGDIQRTVAAALAGTRPFEQTVEKALQGSATASDWELISMYDPSGYVGSAPGKRAPLATLIKLTDLAPANMPLVRAHLAATLLAQAAQQAANPRQKVYVAQVTARGGDYLRLLLASDETIRASWMTLLLGASDIVPLLQGPLPAAGKAEIEQRWLAAVDKLRQDQQLPILGHLLLPAPKLAFYLHAHSQPVPAALLKEVQDSVAAADRAATTASARHAVLDSASDLLIEAGDLDGARRLLEAELKKTNTPWFYEANLADVELKAGREPDALAWSAKGRDDALGPATKMQWIVQDAQLVAKAKGLDHHAIAARLVADADLFYAVALKEPDGFSGRNSMRAHRLSGLLKAGVPVPQRLALVSRYEGKCAAQAPAQRERCVQHFEGLKFLPPPPPQPSPLKHR